jgi:antitoxin component YwqK of YwqJK toxin-antitoxin module
LNPEPHWMRILPALNIMKILRSFILGCKKAYYQSLSPEKKKLFIRKKKERAQKLLEEIEGFEELIKKYAPQEGRTTIYYEQGLQTCLTQVALLEEENAFLGITA